VQVARATRDPEALVERTAASRRRGDRPLPTSLALLGASPVALGASPRASIYLLRAARARALLDGRRFATPHDVKRVAPDVLRHRVVLTYEAEADGVTPEAVVDSVLASVEIP